MVFIIIILNPFGLRRLGEDAFIGLLLDGFPVYGPVENSIRLTNDDLDDYHGHIHDTPEFPEGIYHYHITDESLG